MRELSIIILQHNTPSFVEENLNALQNAILPPDTQIIVVNNGGNDANQKIASSAHQNLNIKFFDTPNIGFPAGNNFGLSKTQANYYAFVNPDIVVNPYTIQKLLHYMKAHPKAGIVSPQLRYRDGTVQDNYRVFPRILDLIIKRIPLLRKQFPKRMQRYLLWDREPNINEAVDWVTGAFTLLSQECMNAIQKHDDDHYFLFMSDVALCREAYKKGFETHIVGSVSCLHNDLRVSSGGLKDVFKKRIIRLHIKDAISYFWHYKFEKLPTNAPSVSRVKNKERLLFAHKIGGRSFLKKLGTKLQKNNPVVHVYEAEIDAKYGYKQPIVFFDTGVVSVIKNQKGEFGLIKIWRHTPLQSNRKNTFPVFPDVGDLGIMSYETIRGGVEKEDPNLETALRRELFKEAGIKAEDIIEIKPLASIIGNTAIDIYRAYNFEVVLNDNFKFKVHDDAEKIIQFKFYTLAEINELVLSNQLVCGLSQAAILQSIATSASSGT